MKANRLICIFLFLMLGVAAAQQTNSASDVINSETIEFAKAGAEKGDAHLQYILGGCYALGMGVNQDYAEAAKWYRKAADQGVADAQYHLGLCYGLGQGVSLDYIEAAKWYRMAAEQGNPNAQYNLGVMYHNGEGVPQDSIQSYKWFNLAAIGGDGKAIEQRNKTANVLTSDQLAEAQQLSSAFVPKKETPSSNSNSSSSVAADSPIACGTGFFITDDGYLISNYHVVKEATKVCLVTSAGMVNAKVVSVDVANDLALLKANLPWYAPVTDTIVKTNAAPWAIILHNNTAIKFSPLPISSSRTVHLGGTVATIGFPDPSLQGFSPKLAKGEIASLSGAGDDPRYFQISVPVQPGNSGGALVDEHGNVIGIVSAKLDASVALAASGALPENVNYAVKSSFLLSFLESAPDVSAKLKEPITVDRKFEDVVKSAQDAAVLVLVY